MKTAFWAINLLGVWRWLAVAKQFPKSHTGSPKK